MTRRTKCRAARALNVPRTGHRTPPTLPSAATGAPAPAALLSGRCARAGGSGATYCTRWPRAPTTSRARPSTPRSTAALTTARSPRAPAGRVCMCASVCMCARSERGAVSVARRKVSALRALLKDPATLGRAGLGGPDWEAAEARRRQSEERLRERADPLDPLRPPHARGSTAPPRAPCSQTRSVPTDKRLQCSLLSRRRPLPAPPLARRRGGVHTACGAAGQASEERAVGTWLPRLLQGPAGGCPRGAGVPRGAGARQSAEAVGGAGRGGALPPPPLLLPLPVALPYSGGAGRGGRGRRGPGGVRRRGG